MQYTGRMKTCGQFADGVRRGAAAVFAFVILIVVATIHSSARCEPAPRVEVIGTSLRAHLPDGSIREADALVGARLVATAFGQTVRVRIASIEPDVRDPYGEVLLYDFRVVASDGQSDGQEEPLCKPDPDGRRLGFPLAGRTNAAGVLASADPATFELVCTSGAQGKCVRFGYAPWRMSKDGRSMLDAYNSCVHMVRGDYCGDGRPFTRDGMLIDVYDHIGVQKPENDQSLSFEAAWGPHGAICVAHTRVPEIINLDGLAKACPGLDGRLGPNVCSENVAGALVFNKSR
jgi:ADYC domain